MGWGLTDSEADLYQRDLSVRIPIPSAIGCANGSGITASSENIWSRTTMTTLLTTTHAARLLGVSTSTLAHWRIHKKPGPAFVRVGKRVFYNAADIHAYVLAHTIQHTDGASS